MNGTVDKFFARYGYGFITGEDGENYFVHQSDINKEGFRKLKPGTKVTFDVTDGEKGKRATNVNEVA